MSAWSTKFSLAAVVALAATPAIGIAPGVTSDSGSTVIGITGFVPVICHARLSSETVPVVDGVTTQLGNLREFCNSPNGYRVMADYSPSLANAKLLVDGQAVALPAGGSVQVSSSDKPAIDVRSLALEAPEGTTGGSISFRIETR